MKLPHTTTTHIYTWRHGSGLSNASICIVLLLLRLLAICSIEAAPHPTPANADGDDNFRRNYAVEYGAPLITPLMEYVTLEMNTNYTIRCEANEPLLWKVTLNTPAHEVKTFDTGDPQRSFGSMLYLLEISYLNVGSYYCIKESSVSKSLDEMLDEEVVELVNNNKASSIYVYVNDPANLLALTEFPIITAYQYQDTVIPCKPTMPNIEVLLTTSHGETFSSESTGRYDPQRGFVVEIRGITDSGSYMCRPKVPSLDNEEQEQTFEIHFVGNEPINPSTKYIEKPVITSNSRGHVNVGENFTLNCYVKIAFDVSYTTQWKTPAGVKEHRMVKTTPRFINSTSTHQVGLAMLTILNAQNSDSGLYKCICTDHSNNVGRNNYQMTVLNRDEGYINISEPSGYYKIVSSANKKVQINVKYRGYPFPTLTWYKPDKTQIHPSKKYMINTTDTSITLQILNAQLEDSGEYVIRAKNELLVKELQFNVSITDKPKVTVKDVYVKAGEEAHLQCRVLSYPTAIVSWVFTPCSISPRWPSCDKRLEQNFNSTRNAQPGELAIEYIHDLYFTPEKPGIIHCLAANPKGMGEGKGHVLIGDISDNMTIVGIDENKKIARGDEVTLTCAALSYYFSDDLDWYKDGELVEESNNFVITNSSTSYSYQRTLKINNIQERSQGSYECRARNANNYDQQESKYISIFVYEPLPPKMIHTNLDENAKLERKLGDFLELECTPEAIPAANVHWYKDDIELTNGSNIAIEEDGNKLVIQYIKPEDEGIYKCVAVNRLGSVDASSAVKITNLPRMRTGWILGLLFFFVILIALVIYLCVRVLRERRRLRDYKAAGLANFEEGDVEHINPALTLDEQADLLPYDRAFEFPREKLKLGKQLGAGAFGVVLKAHAEGIRPDEKETVVAVKMVKRIADNEVMRALVTELKIMVHLGPNLNVVNLLGAVTRNIAQRELMVIVEYCRYGNVQNFLLRNRKRFINQIHPETDKIDPTITKQRFSENFELNRDGVKYVNLSFSNHQYVNHMNNVNNNYTANNRRNSENDPRSGTRAGRPNSAGYLRQSDLYEGHVDSGATEQTVMTTIPEGECRGTHLIIVSKIFFVFNVQFDHNLFFVTLLASYAYN
ncbi:vascular endothelial growth factor receptor 1-like isoform X2 [Rhagoletis pomonella]|uniref:vascular endothelial growth factor receptor 1-like isoform X2 n=1 Tax=Rhagoletis pomonella TaxID=28610 RepID=UPI00177D89B2|nr:vascular endothelial growth factor receptor 1-like isoform X2 [Rhagoletis pomonella]